MKNGLKAQLISNTGFVRAGKVFTVLFVLLSLSFVAAAAGAADIASVQSITIRPYDEALNGFRKTCTCDVRNFVLSDMKGKDIDDEIHKTKPDVIIAVGIDALNSVALIKDVPIVYMMILHPPASATGRENITGVSMVIPPVDQLYALPKIIPDVKTIGLIYDPRRSGDFVSKVKLASVNAGLRLVAKEVSNPKDVPAVLESMKHNIDAFWMVPDVTVVTPDTAEYLFLYSFNNSIPVITFSRKYLDMGALISLEIDPDDIGRQAGEMVQKILSGTNVRDVSAVSARRIVPKINRMAARKLGIETEFVIYKK